MRSKLLVLLALLFSFQARATNFVDNLTSLPGTKVDVNPVVGPANQNLAAAEFNTLVQSVYDVRSVLLRNYLIKSYGAIGNGVTDDSGAITTATAAVVAGGGGVLYFPSGTFRISSNITIPIGVVIDWGSSTWSIDNGVTVLFKQPFYAPPRQLWSFAASPTATPVQWGVIGNPQNAKGSPVTAYTSWWGTKCDNSTDDWAAFQQAINSYGFNPNPIISAPVFGMGGTLIAPPGICKIGTTLHLGVGAQGLVFSGSSSATVLSAGTTLSFTMTNGTPGMYLGGEPITGAGVTSLQQFSLSNMFLTMQGVGGGPTMTLGTVVNSLFTNLYVFQSNANASAINIPSGAPYGNTSNLMFKDISAGMPAGQTAPTIFISGGGLYPDGGCNLCGQASEISFLNLLANESITAAAPAIVLAATSSTGVGIQDISFKSVRFEAPFGGALHLYGVPNVTLENATAGDTASAAGASMIQITDAAAYNGQTHSNPPVNVRISNFWTDIGNVARPTVFVDAGNVIVESCTVPYMACAQGECLVLSSVVNGIDGGIPLAIGGVVTPLVTPPVATVNNGITGITGISASATGVPANNLRGSVSCANLATSCTYNFPVAETDTSYFLTFGPPVGAGLPAAGSNRIQRVVKAQGSFTITLEVATTEIQTFDWILLR